jgi:putative nucleotidyltransferase with HDIG domain
MSELWDQHDGTFPFCPAPPDWKLDWPAVEAAFPWVRAMCGCPQDPHYHAEGDVLTHTRLVCEALAANPAWRDLAPTARNMVFAATLMHDVGKPAVTRSEDDRITARGHARRGAQMMRSEWYRNEAECSLPRMAIREQVVGLIRRHGAPLYALDSDDPAGEVIRASQTARCDWLAMLAWADVAGRRCADQAALFDRIEFFRELARELDCWEKPFEFPSAHSRFLYFRTRGADPRRLAYDDTKTEVALLSGLPGAGKDAWLQRHGNGRPVISLDELRREMRVSPDEEQGAVASRARDLARGYLREWKPFIWNATNTTRMIRDSLIPLFHQYGARVRIVYLETSWTELRRRNRQREAGVPLPVLEKLVERLETPDRTEAHELEWIAI